MNRKDKDMVKATMLTMKIEPDLKNAVRRAAKENRRSMSDYVRLVLEHHMATDIEKNRSAAA